MRARMPAWAALVGLILISVVAPVRSQPLQVAGDGTHLWILRSVPAENREFALLHRARGAVNHWDEPDLFLRRVDTFRGRVLPGGMAASPGRLWLVFEDMSVQSLLIERDIEQNTWRYQLMREVPLPQGASLLAMAANQEGLWALLRVETAQVLAQVDTPPDKNSPLSGIVVPRIARPKAVLPPDLRPPDAAPPENPPLPPEAEAPTEQPAPGTEAEAGAAPGRQPGEAAPTQPIAAIRLVWFRNETWHKVDLPEDWPPDSRVWMAFTDSHAAKPILVTTLPGDGTDRLRVYRHDGQAWHSQVYTLNVDGEPTAAGELHVMALGPSLVVGRRIDDPGRVMVALSVLAPEGVRPIGRVSLESEPAARWAMAPFGETIAVLAKAKETPPPQGRLRWSRIDLSGRIAEESTILFEDKPRPLGWATDQLPLVFALAVATLIMFVFWRRDPQWNQLELPETLMLADPARRAMAAAIDLFPCIAISALLFADVGMQEVITHWPMWSRHAAIPTMAPAGLAIGIFVLYTTVAELFTARTVGKALMGLRVTGLRGEPPNLWQVLLRNVMKALELVAPLLLILPLIGPFRQRLGDLVARTVIVAPRGPEDMRKEPDEGPTDDRD